MQGRTIESSNKNMSVSDGNDGFWTKVSETSDTQSKRVKRPVDLSDKITSNVLTPEQASAYQIMYRVEEISRKIMESDYEYCNRPQQNRSPSPPPIYDAKGKRTNTRELRYKKKLEDERHRLIDLSLKLIPHYRAPEGYVKPTNFKDKFFIPVSEYQHINFVGLLLGPRGNTLKQLQQSTGCKIAIRGRGSVKEGKSALDLPKDAMNLTEPLHCVIIADTEEKMKKGLKACEAVVIKAVTSPEGQNDLKRGQLRELAELNGTLREDNRPCAICGLLGHKRFDCPQREVYADKIICEKCGKSGHVAQDCLVISKYNGIETRENIKITNNKRRIDTQPYNAEIYQDDRQYDVKRIKTVQQNTPLEDSEITPAVVTKTLVSKESSMPSVETGPPGLSHISGPPGMFNQPSIGLEVDEMTPPPPPPPPSSKLDLGEEINDSEECLPPPPGL